MAERIIIWLTLFLILLGAVFYASPYFPGFLNQESSQKIPELNIATSSLNTFFGQSKEQEIIQVPPTAVNGKPSAPKLQPATAEGGAPPKAVAAKPQPLAPAIPAVKEVSSKSLTELINSSIVQLYCGNMDAEKTEFSGISRGTGIIINSGGTVLTSRHIIYDEIFKKPKSDCFILKNSFPNPKGEKPKIYYFAKIENWPQTEKFSKDFSSDKYYNDFALLKIGEKTTGVNSKIGAMLGFNYAGLEDYEIMENAGRFNFLPIDWSYVPRVGDNVISAGYGTDASHEARQITSTAGTVEGNIEVLGGNRIEMLIIKGNATAGFSGGALIHPQSKGLVGLVSWVSAGAKEGKFMVAIFRDFLSILINEELKIDFRELTKE